jgi:hypothetical protein
VKEARDDTHALIDALHAQKTHGDLVLPKEIIVNGVRYDAGRYRLVYAGRVIDPELDS